jgi:hypothetical protein
MDRRGPTIRLSTALLGLFALSAPVVADPAGFNYGGRLVSSDGKPVAGTVDLEVKFFDDDVAGSQVGPTKPVNDVQLVNGVFSIPVDLNAAERDTILGTGNPIWIEIKDVTHNKVYPRQSFSAVPYALRVPVDGTTIDYNGSGQLEVLPGGLDISGVTQSALSVDGPGSNDVTIQAAPGAIAPTTLTLPPDAGTGGYVLSTNGSGVLSWINPATGGGGDMLVSVYDNEGAGGVIDLANGGTGANLLATGGAGQYLKQSSAGGAVTVGTIAAGDIPSGIDAANVGLGNVDDVSVLNTFTQNDAQNIGTDEIRARDAGGLKLFNDAGSAGLFVDDSGNVGLGTTSPSARLQAVDSGTGVSIRAQSSAANASTSIQVSDGADAAFYVGVDGGLNNLWLGNDNVGKNQLVVTSGGNVGIGTSAPIYKLQVAGNGMFSNDVRTNGNFYLASNNAHVGWGAGNSYIPAYSGTPTGVLNSANSQYFNIDSANASPGTTAFVFAKGSTNIAGSELMRISENGNVGVGVASPTDKLEVNGRIRATHLCDEAGGNCKDLSVASSIGSVTSVGITQPAAGITASGGPITSSGSITLALANDLAAVEGLGTTGIVRRTGVDTWSTITDNSATWNDATLSGLAAIAPTNNQLIYANGNDTFTTTSLTAAGRAILDDADATAQRTTLGLAIGSDVQAYDATLGGIAATDTAADQLIYSNGVNTFTTTGFSAAARTLLDDATTGDMLTTLGVTNPLATFTQNDNQRIGTDEIRARDADGLKLYDDSGAAGIFVEDGGEVGIGTTSPSYLLDVNASTTGGTVAQVRNPTAGTGNYASVRVDTDAGTMDIVTLSSTWTTNGWNVQAGSSIGAHGVGGLSVGTSNGVGVLRLYTGGSSAANERMRIDSAGNVGIGTTTPATLLHVAKTGGGTQDAALYSASGGANGDGARVYLSGNSDVTRSAFIEGRNIEAGAANEHALIFGTSGPSASPTERMRIDGSGNVGIGTTAPGQLLHVHKNAGSGYLFSTTNGSTATDYTGMLFGVDNDGTQNFATIGMRGDSGALRLSGNGGAAALDSPHMIISDGGNVGIGTADPAVDLQVAGQIAGGYFADTDRFIDWNLGNIQSTTAAANTLVFTTGSMVNGASYTLSLQNATGGSYVLSSADITTWKCIPACAANTVTVDAGKDTVLTILKMGTIGYVSWIKGF